MSKGRGIICSPIAPSTTVGTCHHRERQQHNNVINHSTLGVSAVYRRKCVSSIGTGSAEHRYGAATTDDAAAAAPMVRADQHGSAAPGAASSAEMLNRTSTSYLDSPHGCLINHTGATIVSLEAAGGGKRYDSPSTSIGCFSAGNNRESAAVIAELCTDFPPMTRFACSTVGDVSSTTKGRILGAPCGHRVAHGAAMTTPPPARPPILPSETGSSQTAGIGVSRPAVMSDLGIPAREYPGDLGANLETVTTTQQLGFSPTSVPSITEIDGFGDTEGHPRTLPTSQNGRPRFVLAGYPGPLEKGESSIGRCGIRSAGSGSDCNRARNKSPGGRRRGGDDSVVMLGAAASASGNRIKHSPPFAFSVDSKPTSSEGHSPNQDYPDHPSVEVKEKAMVDEDVLASKKEQRGEENGGGEDENRGGNEQQDRHDDDSSSSNNNSDSSEDDLLAVMTGNHRDAIFFETKNRLKRVVCGSVIRAVAEKSDAVCASGTGASGRLSNVEEEEGEEEEEEEKKLVDVQSKSGAYPGIYANAPEKTNGLSVMLPAEVRRRAFRNAALTKKYRPELDFPQAPGERGRSFPSASRSAETRHPEPAPCSRNNTTRDERTAVPSVCVCVGLLGGGGNDSGDGDSGGGDDDFGGCNCGREQRQRRDQGNGRPSGSLEKSTDGLGDKEGCFAPGEGGHCGRRDEGRVGEDTVSRAGAGAGAEASAEADARSVSDSFLEESEGHDDVLDSDVRCRFWANRDGIVGEEVDSSWGGRWWGVGAGRGRGGGSGASGGATVDKIRGGVLRGYREWLVECDGKKEKEEEIKTTDEHMDSDNESRWGDDERSSVTVTRGNNSSSRASSVAFATSFGNTFHNDHGDTINSFHCATRQTKAPVRTDAVEKANGDTSTFSSSFTCTNTWGCSENNVNNSEGEETPKKIRPEKHNVSSHKQRVNCVPTGTEFVKMSPIKRRHQLRTMKKTTLLLPNLQRRWRQPPKTAAEISRSTMVRPTPKTLQNGNPVGSAKRQRDTAATQPTWPLTWDPSVGATPAPPLAPIAEALAAAKKYGKSSSTDVDVTARSILSAKVMALGAGRVIDQDVVSTITADENVCGNPCKKYAIELYGNKYVGDADGAVDDTAGVAIATIPTVTTDGILGEKSVGKNNKLLTKVFNPYRQQTLAPGRHGVNNGLWAALVGKDEGKNEVLSKPVATGRRRRTVSLDRHYRRAMLGLYGRSCLTTSDHAAEVKNTAVGGGGAGGGSGCGSRFGTGRGNGCSNVDNSNPTSVANPVNNITLKKTPERVGGNRAHVIVRGTAKSGGDSQGVSKVGRWGRVGGRMANSPVTETRRRVGMVESEKSIGGRGHGRDHRGRDGWSVNGRLLRLDKRLWGSSSVTGSKVVIVNGNNVILTVTDKVAARPKVSPISGPPRSGRAGFL